MGGMSAEDGGLSVALGTGVGAMKKLFAYAAIALFGTGALIVTTHSNAKSGGFAGGFKGNPWMFAKPHFAPHLHAAAPHHFALAHNFAHRHRFARGFGFDFPYADFDAPYAEPQIIEVPREADDDVPAPTGPRRVSVWRGNSPDSTACSVQNVTVPSSQGGDATVRVIRC
jgi:hypothetical protein